jgi:hypothetical protein
MENYTTIEKRFRNMDLYQWSSGLRMRGCLPGQGRIKGRVHFDPFGHDLERVPCGHGQLIRQVRKLTDEVWVVHKRQGGFWRVDYYLVPKLAKRDAERAMVRRGSKADQKALALSFVAG